jgi:hypothetical protein
MFIVEEYRNNYNNIYNQFRERDTPGGGCENKIQKARQKNCAPNCLRAKIFARQNICAPKHLRAKTRAGYCYISRKGQLIQGILTEGDGLVRLTSLKQVAAFNTEQYTFLSTKEVIIMRRSTVLSPLQYPWLIRSDIS